MRRVPTVVSLDATPVNFDRVGSAYSHSVSNPAFEAAKRAVNRRTFGAAAGIVTWCRWAADSLREDYGVPGEKIRVIPPGVDVSGRGAGAAEGVVEGVACGLGATRWPPAGTEVEKVAWPAGGTSQAQP